MKQGIIKYQWAGKLLLVALLLLSPLTVTIPAQAAVKYCTSTTPLSERPNLYQGDTGSCVGELQSRLKSKGYTITVDNDFGPKTYDTVKLFQAAAKITVDGKVGPTTWSKLLGTTPPTTYDPYRCGNTSSKVLLVFDDYPLSLSAWKSLIYTAKVNNIGIGVAPNGQYVRYGTADVSYARQNGMLVVDHTYDHKDLTTLSSSQIAWEITQPYIGSNYVRPPYGAYNSTVSQVFATYSKKNCLWNLDPQDWNGKSPQAAADYIITYARAGSTAVVHLNHLGTQPSLLPYIKAGLAKRGLTMCTPWSSATPATMGNSYCS